MPLIKTIDAAGDPGLPTLRTVFDHHELSGLLRSLSLIPQHSDASSGIQVRVLKWWPASRCTFEIAFESLAGCRELIGKVYAQNRPDIYQVMENIWKAGFDSEKEFAIPRPIAYLEPLRLLLCEKVPGVRAKKLLLGSDQAVRARAATQCARWLAQFHATAPRFGPILGLSEYLVHLEKLSESFAEFGSASAAKAKQLFQQLERAASRLGDGMICASHGTFGPGQVLLTDTCTFTVDWDTYGVTHPCRDVARFLVELTRIGCKYFDSLRALDRTARIFLQTYVTSSLTEFTVALPFHVAAICLERAKNDIDKRARGWQERADRMLHEGLRVLTHQADCIDLFPRESADACRS